MLKSIHKDIVPLIYYEVHKLNLDDLNHQYQKDLGQYFDNHYCRFQISINLYQTDYILNYRDYFFSQFHNNVHNFTTGKAKAKLPNRYFYTCIKSDFS